MALGYSRFLYIVLDLVNYKNHNLMNYLNIIYLPCQIHPNTCFLLFNHNILVINE